MTAGHHWPQACRKAGDSVIDLDGCEHEMPLFRMMNVKTVQLDDLSMKSLVYLFPEYLLQSRSYPVVATLSWPPLQFLTTGEFNIPVAFLCVGRNSESLIIFS